MHKNWECRSNVRTPKADAREIITVDSVEDDIILLIKKW